MSLRSVLLTLAFMALVLGALAVLLAERHAKVASLTPAQHARTGATEAPSQRIDRNQRTPKPDELMEAVIWSVTGRIESSSGLALVGANVCAVTSVDGCCLPRECTVSGLGGHFSFSTTSPAMEVLASKPGFGSVRRKLESPRHGRRGEPNDLTLTLEPVSGAVVNGRVADATGGPVAGALIVARAPSSAAVRLVTATSDGDGRFYLDVLSGPTELVASADGYSGARKLVDAPTSDATLVMVPASSISGHVLALDTGKAISRARVTAINVNGSFAPLVQTETAADGSFQLNGLSTGSYLLSGDAEGWQTERQHILLEMADGVREIELRLSHAASLHARISVAGEPCAGASVMLRGLTLLSGVADAMGALSLTNLAPGEYDAAISCEGAVAMEDRLMVIGREQLERHWKLERGTAIVGVVTRSNGEPLARPTVTAVPAPTGAGAEQDVGAQGHAVNCVANEVGAFTCSGVEPGLYDVGLDSQGQAWAAMQRVAVQPNSDARVVITAPPLAGITVSLRGSESARNGIAVFAQRREGGAPIRALSHGSEFTLSDLRLGHYDVYLPSARDRAVNVYLSADGEVQQVALEPSDAVTIAGRVVDDSGSPMPDVWVRANSVDDPTAGAVGGAVLSSAEGEFRLDVPAGDYRLFAAGPGGEAELDRVRGGTTDAVIRVPVFGRLFGSVRTRSGANVGAFSVSYAHENGAGATVAGQDGIWSVDWLAPGNYTVAIESSAGTARGTAVVPKSAASAELRLIVSSTPSNVSSSGLAP